MNDTPRIDIFNVGEALFNSELLAFLFIKQRIIIRANSALHTMFGYADGELVNQSTRILFPDDHSYESFGQTVYAPLREGGVYRGENLLRRKDDSLGWFQLSMSMWCGQRDIAAGSITDISDYKSHWQEREARLDELIRCAMDAIVAVDAGHRILIFNPAAERLFQRSAYDMMGQPLDVLIPERFRAAHHEQTRVFMMSGNTSRRMGALGQICGVRADGEEIELEASISRSIGQGQTLYTVFIRDITERKRTEQALRSSHAQIRAYVQHLDNAIENERLRMAREIHDDLGQSLTAIKMDIAALQRRLAMPHDGFDTTQIEQRLGEMSSTADATISTVRRIASELRPPLLDKFSLADAIRQQCRMYEERTGCVCHTEISFDGVLEEATVLGIFRIFQEALTNISRHARATKVVIELHKQNEQLLLAIHNDGRAITAAEANHPRSFGLHGMRERARILHGELNIQGEVGVGTTVRLRIPLTHEKKTRSAVFASPGGNASVN